MYAIYEPSDTVDQTIVIEWCYLDIRGSKHMPILELNVIDKIEREYMEEFLSFPSVLNIGCACF